MFNFFFFFFFFFFFLLSSQILNIRSKITFVWGAGNNNIKQIYFFYFLQEMWVVAYAELMHNAKGFLVDARVLGWLLGHLWYVDSS